MIGLRRSLLAALLVWAASGCGDEATQPELPSLASKLTGGASGWVEPYEDRLQHAAFLPDEGAFGVIRQCQANPVEDADGNDWTTTKKGGTTYSKLVEPGGVVLVREVALGAGDFDALGNLIVPGYTSDRWVVSALGIGHITISLWRDALGQPVALNSQVHADVAPIGPEDSWIGILDEPGDTGSPGAHDLTNEVFLPGSTALTLFQAAVAEARADRTLRRLSCDLHVQYAGGVPVWVQRNGVELR